MVRSRFRSRLRILNLSLFLLVSFCALPPRLSNKLVEQNLEPQEGVKRLSELQSFRFCLRYYTDVPVRIRAQFSGVFNQPDLESWDGFYVKNGRKVKAVMRAREEMQMQLSDAGWQVQPRGLETMILKQVEQVLTEAKFEFLREEKGRVLYQFEPKVSLIDPLRVKRLKGIIELDRFSGLPVRLACFDDRGTAEWELRLASFNRASRVELPFVPAMRLSLVPQGRFLAKGQRQELMRILKQRFQDFGVEQRQKWMGSALALEIDQTMSTQTLRLLAAKGRVEIYQVSWLKEGQGLGQGSSTFTSTYSSPVMSVRGDAARMIVLETFLADNSLINAAVDCTLPVQPKLIIKFETTNHSVFEDGKPLALVVDGKVQSVTTEIGKKTEDGGRKTELIFTDIDNEETVRAIAALANSQPLPVDLELVCHPQPLP